MLRQAYILHITFNMKRVRKIRYAVVGLGHIAQVAVLPAFKKSKNSEVTALVSGDGKKLKLLSKKYNATPYSYEKYDECLNSGNIDAVYIALPNHLHREYAVRAAQAGIHILCEKPMAVTSQECREINQAVLANRVKLMIAYRLHFDPANIGAIKIIQSKKIGEARYITSEFGYHLKEDNNRAHAIEGTSPLHDMGIYCINACRYLFRAEPEQVSAFAVSSNPDLPEIDQTVSAIMKFPGDRVASFTASFSSSPMSNYRVVGDKGDLFVENAYEYVGKLKHQLRIGEKVRRWTTQAGDQFAPELTYFSDCILRNRDIEPSGFEGLADVKIIEALHKSIQTGKVVRLKSTPISSYPNSRLQAKVLAHKKPKLINVESASK